MRNLKRALSLTLASVMLLGMMVVGSSAAAGYDDVADTDNVEAIEVLQAVEVMVGDERGFGPERPVNRAEMAVVMGKLLNLDYNYYEATCPFNDVYDWARGWVGACYANGIVSGRGEGVYDPGTTVTAVEAASMLMRALGYFKYQSDYANGFEVSTVLQANKIRLFDGVNSKTNEPLTRNQVAQMALNALKSGMVEPDGNALNFIDANGNVIATGGKVNYVYVTSNKSFATAIDDVKASSMGSANDSPIVELGEQLYDGKLKLDDGALDAFGRPSRKWELDGKAIGTYTKRELMVMDNVGKVTGNDLYTLLGAGTIKDYDVLVTIDGVDNKRTDAKAILGEKVFTEAVDMNRNNKAEIGGTGTGVLTQVFVDHEDDEVYVAIINTYLARASRDYDDKSEEANLTVYSIDKHNASGEYFKVAKSTKDSEAMKIQDEDFDLAKDIKKNDAFLVQIAEGEIKTIEPAEVLEAATLSAFKLGDHVVSGGADYNYTTTVGYKDGDLDAYTGGDITNLKDRTYNIFLDAYSNLIGLEEVDGVKNYVFLAGIDLDGSNLYNKNATANALFLDGTSKTIKINMAKSVFRNGDLSNTNIVIDGDALLNTWCTYTVSGDVYTVKEVYSTNVDEGNYPQPTVSGAKNTSKLAQYHQTSMPVDNKVDVKRMRLWGATSRTNQFANVYGDSDSVYLTTELSELRNTGEGNDGLSTKLSYGIIKGVDALTTGIADTNITVWTKTQARNEAEKTDLIRDQKVNPSKVDGMTGSDTDNIDNVAYGIYTLYDDEGIIIAAVVVGENEGVKDMVYVHSDVPELESDNGGSAKAADDGLWTWTRKVIRDGQEVTLTEVGDSLDYLGKDQMRQYQWYEIKTNADGEVIDATPAWSALGCYRVDDVTAPIDPKGDVNKDGYFVDLYEDINFRVEDSSKDTVLYQTAGGPVNYANDPACHQHANGGFVKQQLEVKGNNTLAVTTEEGSGIHFRNDVNVVLQYWNQNTKKEEIETGTGADRLKSMVDFVNDNTKAGRGNDEPYYVSALIEKGFATTIVIYDSFNNYKRPEATGNQELCLYGNLFNAANYSTDRYDAVVTVDGKELEPIRRGSDEWGGYTVYSVKSGSTVGINDKDIDSSFDYLTNLEDYDPANTSVKLRVLYRQNSISFVMPKRDAFIIGADNDIEEPIVGEMSKDSSLDNIQATFAPVGGTPVGEGVKIGSMSAGDRITITLKTLARALTLKANTNYEITLGDPAETVPVTSSAAGTISFSYNLTHTDIKNGYVRIEKIVEVEPSTEKTYTVTVAEVENGTVKADKTTAKEGDIVTLTVTPNSGYKVASVVVEYDNFEDQIVTEENKWQFTMPAGDATVVATFVEDGTGTETDISAVDVTVGTIPAIGGTLPTVADIDRTDVSVTAEWAAADKKVAASNVLTITVTPKTGYKVPASFAPTVNGASTGIAAGTTANTWTYTVAGVASDAIDKAVTIANGSGNVTELESGKSYNLTITGTVAGDGAIVDKNWYHVKVGALDGAVQATGTSLVVPAPLAAAAAQYAVTVEYVEATGMNGTTQIKYWGANASGDAVIKFMNIIGASASRMARSVVVNPSAMNDNDPWVIVIGEGETAQTIYTAVDEVEPGVFEIPVGMNWVDFQKDVLSKVKPNADGFKVTTDRFDTGLGINVDGSATVVGGKITAWSFTMGKQPTVGAKLPAEVVLNDGLTLKIDWNPAHEVAAAGTVYTPTFTPVAGTTPLADKVDVTTSVEMSTDADYSNVVETELAEVSSEAKVAVDESGEANALTARKITATVTGSGNPYTATFSVADEEDPEVITNPYDIVDALNNSTWAKTNKYTFEVKDVTLEADGSGSAKSNKAPAVTVNWVAGAPSELYNVTYPTATGTKTVQIADDGVGVEVKDLDRSVKYLMPYDGATPYSNGDDVIEVTTPRIATLTVVGGEDTTYVAAVELVAEGDSSEKYLADGKNVIFDGKTSAQKQWLGASVAASETASLTAIEKDDTKYIMVGAVLYLEKSSVSDDIGTFGTSGSVILTVNGKEAASFPIDKDGNIKGQWITVGASADGKLVMKADKGTSTATTDTPVVIGSAKTPVTKLGNGSYDITDMIQGLGTANAQELTLVYYDSATKKYTPVTVAGTVGSNGTINVTGDEMKVVPTTEIDGVSTIQLFRAYSVQSESENVTLWTAYYDEACTKVIDADAAEYIPVDAANKTIYVKAKSGVRLYDKTLDEVAELEGADKEVDRTAAAGGEIVYTVEVKGNIDQGNTIAALVTFTAEPTAKHATAIAAESDGSFNTVDVTVSGLAFAADKGVVKTATFKPTNLNENIESIAIKTIEASDTSMKLTVTPKGAIAQPNAGEDDAVLGHIYFELITGDVIDINVVLKAKTA